MAIKEKDLRQFDDPTYDELYERIESFVDGARDESAADLAAEVQRALDEERIGTAAGEELMSELVPFLEGNGI